VRTPAAELIRRKGNAVEVLEAIEFLRNGRRDARLHAVTVALAGEMLVLGGLTRDRREAAAAVERALASGAATPMTRSTPRSVSRRSPA
jgi:thymidine phosphorylase